MHLGSMHMCRKTVFNWIFQKHGLENVGDGEAKLSLMYIVSSLSHAVIERIISFEKLRIINCIFDQKIAGH